MQSDAYPKKGGSSAAYDAIMDAIVTQKLAPSQKVSENIFVDMFDISRSAARNVIERLTAEQFLVSLSPRITRVASLTLLDVKQNFALRKMLQPKIFSVSAAHVDFDEVARLNDAIAVGGPIKDDDSALRILKANKHFNLSIAERMNYPLLMNWVRQLEDTSMRIYWLYVKMFGALPYTWEHQREMVEAMKSDRPEEIEKRVYAMLAMSEERLLSAIFSHDQIYKQDLRLP